MTNIDWDMESQLFSVVQTEIMSASQEKERKKEFRISLCVHSICSAPCIICSIILRAAPDCDMLAEVIVGCH